MIILGRLHDLLEREGVLKPPPPQTAPNGAGTPTNPGAYPGPVPGGDDSVALVSVFPPPGTVLQQPGTSVVFAAAMRYKLSSASSERSRSRCAHPDTV